MAKELLPAVSLMVFNRCVHSLCEGHKNLPVTGVTSWTMYLVGLLPLTRCDSQGVSGCHDNQGHLEKPAWPPVY